jgi:alanine racemase
MEHSPSPPGAPGPLGSRRAPGPPAPPSRAVIHLDRLEHNLRLLAELAGGRPVWPSVKANAYGHGAILVGRRLVELGCDTLCVAHAEEALALREAGVRARFVVMSVALPEQAAAFAEQDLEPVVCTSEFVAALARAAERTGRPVPVHVAVDTGMGRIGVAPDELRAFLERCREHAGIRLRGLMSHFPRADEADKSFSAAQAERFAGLCEQTRDLGVEVRHLSNSAAIFDFPEARFDAVRPGISLYGLAPSQAIHNPRVAELQPVLEWRTRITFLKEVASGVGLSYGHSFRTVRPTLVATVSVGYGDGLFRGLSNRLEMLVGGIRCPQVGIITMDQCLVDVTALRGAVEVGDEVVVIGRQGEEFVSADEIAVVLDTLNYEVVTAISQRVPRDDAAQLNG